MIQGLLSLAQADQAYPPDIVDRLRLRRELDRLLPLVVLPRHAGQLRFAVEQVRADQQVRLALAVEQE